MATMGCVPAYDTYFKNGLRNNIKRASSFSKPSFEKLLDLVKNDDKLKKIYGKSCSIKINNITTKYEYTPMKLIDLYFWLLGEPRSKD
jgi:hypothetical protein